MDDARTQAANAPVRVRRRATDLGRVAKTPKEIRRRQADVSRCTSSAHQGSLIVELFGPPSAGKTTLARALAAALASKGFPVQLVSSSRPAEQDIFPNMGKLQRLGSAVTAPLKRAVKIFGALSLLLPGVAIDPITSGLMEMIQPRSWLGAFRKRRYLAILYRSWSAARASDHIVIFDQGYISAVCSLNLLADPTDPRAMARGLDLVPAPDVLVRLEAPQHVLEQRLRERIGRQSVFERMFEKDIETSLCEIKLASMIDAMLLERGRRSMRFRCLDDEGLEVAVSAIIGEITTSHRGVVS
ncbi:MAG TPA: hypothetical protein VIL33_04980 [Rhodothermia bacterium]